MKLSELLRVGKETQDVPQSIFDAGKTDGKFAELRDLASAAGGLADDLAAIKANPLGFSLGIAAGGLIESLKEYAGDQIEMDIFDGEGNPIFS